MRLSSPLPLFICFFMRQIKSSTSSSIAFLMTTTVTPSSSTHSLRVSLKDSQKNSAPMRPVRIVSYNVLSSKLSRPSHFTHANPDHLTMEYRLPLILQRLEREMDRSPIGSENNADDEPTERSLPPPPTIFALQEICYPFTSELHAFFAQRGYQFITGLYGMKTLMSRWQFISFCLNNFFSFFSSFREKVQRIYGSGHSLSNRAL